MPYVERDGSGNVTGTAHRPQPGRAEEFLPDDHPEVVAYRNPPPPDPVDTATNPADIERALLTKGVLTPADIADAKRNR